MHSYTLFKLDNNACRYIQQKEKSAIKSYNMLFSIDTLLLVWLSIAKCPKYKLG